MITGVIIMSADDNKVADIEALKPGVVEAIDAMLALDSAVRENGLSIQDLMDGLALAIEGPRQGCDGHDMALIAMGMMTIALERDKTRSTLEQSQ